MRSNDGNAKLEESISKCFKEGTPECLQELSKLIGEQEHLMENKYLLYKMVTRHLATSGNTDALRP